MKHIFENWRAFSDPILLIEGRIGDTRKRYPELAEKGLIDILIDRDPSGNQKYLAWAAKKLATQTVQKQASAEKVADTIEKFHKLQPFLARENEKYRDINFFKKLAELDLAIQRAQDLKAQADLEKAKVEAEKKEAMAGTEILYKDKDFFMVRPTTKEASCYWGRGSQWCISATKYKNYFDQYTSERKGFFFVMMKNKKNFPTAAAYNEISWDRHKMIALEFDTDDSYPEFVQGWDAQDNPMHEEEIWHAMGTNVLGWDTYDAFMTFKDDYGGDMEDFQEEFGGAEEEDVKLVKEMYKKFNLSFETDDVDDVYNDLVLYKWSEIEGVAEMSLRDNPPGPSAENFQTILDKYELSYIHVLYDEYDDAGWWWQGGARIEVQDLVDEVVADLGIDDIDVEPEDLISAEKIIDILDDNWIYPSEHDIDGDDILLDFHPDQYGVSAGLEAFDSFLEDIKSYDKNWPEALKDIKEVISEKIAELTGPEQLSLFESKKTKFKIKLRGKNKC